MLARRAAAEVLVGHDDVARLHAFDERRVEILQAVLRQLRRIGRGQVAGRDDDVGIDVAPVAVRGSFELHDRSSS